MNTFLESIADSRGREAIIEDIVYACAMRKGFDDYLPSQAELPQWVYRGRRGHADVEIFGPNEEGYLGIEVKVSAQVNWGMYGGSVYRSQLEVMTDHVENLVVITSKERAGEPYWPENAVVLTLEDLASIAKTVQLSADELVKVALGVEH